MHTETGDQVLLQTKALQTGHLHHILEKYLTFARLHKCYEYGLNTQQDLGKDAQKAHRLQPVQIHYTSLRHRQGTFCLFLNAWGSDFALLSLLSLPREDSARCELDYV